MLFQLSRVAPKSACILSRGLLPIHACSKRCASTTSDGPKLQFNWQDPLISKDLLNEEEIAIAETAREYCQEMLLPRVLRKILISLNTILPK